MRYAVLIVRKILHEYNLRSAESRLFQCGGVGLLLGWKAGQHPAGEVCYYLKHLRCLFQGEEEVVYYC